MNLVVIFSNIENSHEIQVMNQVFIQKGDILFDGNMVVENIGGSIQCAARCLAHETCGAFHFSITNGVSIPI